MVAERRNVAKLFREARSEALGLLREVQASVLEELPEPLDREPLSRAALRERMRSMTDEEMEAWASKVGHQDDEETPCDLCAMIAYEHKLSQRGQKGGDAK